MKYEDRLKAFLEENEPKLEKIKKVGLKLKIAEKSIAELKSEIQDSLESYNLSGYSDDDVTISRIGESTRWGFKKDVKEDERNEIRDMLCNTYPDYFDYNKIKESWKWSFK